MNKMKFDAKHYRYVNEYDERGDANHYRYVNEYTERGFVLYTH